MLLFLSIAGLVSLVPLSIWAATGRADRAWQALREYMIAMAVLVVPALVVAAITLLPRIWNG
jgi:hypothetical protein